MGLCAVACLCLCSISAISMITYGVGLVQEAANWENKVVGKCTITFVESEPCEYDERINGTRYYYDGISDRCGNVTLMASQDDSECKSEYYWRTHDPLEVDSTVTCYIDDCNG